MRRCCGHRPKICRSRTAALTSRYRCSSCAPWTTGYELLGGLTGLATGRSSAVHGAHPLRGTASGSTARQPHQQTSLPRCDCNRPRSTRSGPVGSRSSASSTAPSRRHRRSCARWWSASLTPEASWVPMALRLRPARGDQTRTGMPVRRTTDRHSTVALPVHLGLLRTPSLLRQNRDPAIECSSGRHAVATHPLRDVRSRRTTGPTSTMPAQATWEPGSRSSQIRERAGPPAR